jgi:Flp pilus assembly pilin Flp
MQRVNSSADAGLSGTPAASSERGATAVEYSLLLALIASVIFAVVVSLGQAVAAIFQNFVAIF